MNRHSSLPPGDCGMRGAVAGRPSRCSRVVHGIGGLVSGVEDSPGGEYESGAANRRLRVCEQGSWLMDLKRKVN
jgi:hypothetical protein